MVFKRRDRRPIGRTVLEFLWPRGGWARAAQYVKHRLHRLPDPPHRIARGIFAGVFTTFTPFYGLHFVTAAALAWVVRGNVVAALLSTFFGNPLTYLPIITSSMYTGYWLLGLDPKHLRFHRLNPEDGPTIGERFADAGETVWHNFKAIFTPETANWDALGPFMSEVFYPFLIGGIIPGIIAGGVCYRISLPLITAYQNRRKGLLKEKLARFKRKS